MSPFVSIQEVKTQKELRSVYQLTHDTFFEKKLIQKQKDLLLINNRKLDAHQDTTIFIGRIDDKIRGTISISFHQNIEEVYNYSIFKKLLKESYDHNLPSISGWRLATQGSPLERYLLTINLIMHGNSLGMNLKVSQAFFSFIPEQSKVYNNLFPSGEILGNIRKKTKFIDSELVLMKYCPSTSCHEHLEKVKKNILNMYYKKLG